jgi:thiamine biosynthesis protein ThiS
MRITLNGDPREVAEGRTLPALLAELGAAAEHVAVEHNGEIVERADFGAVVLRAGDRLEIVRFVGGG